MKTKRTRITLTPRSALLALGVVGIVVAWVMVFYLPQTQKLRALGAQQTSLQQTVTADEVRLAQLQKEAQHVTQIRAMYNQLSGYVPSTEDVYTYIHTISGAAKAAGVTITSLAPSALSPITGTSYMALPIDASVKGTYDHLLAFIKDLYNLPRLTDVNAISINGGGPGTNRGTDLSVELQLAIFTSQKATGA